MQRDNLNVMIFDDDQQPVRKQDITKYTSQSKNIKPSTSNGHSSQKNIKKPPQNQNITLIAKQIAQLQSKLRILEKDGQKIRYQIQKRNISDGKNTVKDGNSSIKVKQIQQILMIVQKKIQLIIQQSKKLISKMSETVDKKLIQLQKQQQNQKKKVQISNDKSKNKLNQIQHTLRHKLEEYQHFYKNQYQKILKESKKKQQTMMKKLSQMELKFTNKLNTFQTKEKQYVDWIHHLQAKLKQKKSKKMITITQQKPQLSPIPSINTVQSHQKLPTKVNQNNIQNIPSLNFQTSKMNCSIDQNNSKVIRKHKIFGDGKSTSPAPRANSRVSPTKDSVPLPQGFNNMQNQPSSSSFYQQNSKAGSSNLNFYNDLKKDYSEKLKQNNYQQEQYNYQQHEQGWDKFADLNDFNQQYTQTQSDDFFNPMDAHETNTNYQRVLANIPLDSRGGTYYGQPFKNQVYQQNKDKVFSPFDLN